MKAHQVKIPMLLLTAFLILNLPSIVQSIGFPVPDSEPKNRQDSQKAENSFGDGLLGLEEILLKDGERRASKDTGAATESSALQSFSRAGYEVSSSQRQLEKAANFLKFCKLDCQQQEVGCLQSTHKSNIFADPLCRNDFAMCSLQCTKNFCDTVTSIPDPPISGEGQDVAMAQQNDEAQKFVRELDMKDAKLLSDQGAANLQRVPSEGGIIVTLAKYAEYGVPEGQTAIPTALQNLTTCRLQTEQQASQCNTDALASAGNDSTKLFALSVCGCQITELFGQLGCARNIIDRFNSSSD